MKLCLRRQYLKTQSKTFAVSYLMSINLQKRQTILTLNLDYLLRVTALSSSNVY